MITLNLINQSKDYAMPKAFLKVWVIELEKALKTCGVVIPRGSELSLVFLDAPAARALNLEYRKRDYATDVLSFQNEDPLGDLVMCPEVLERQAKEHQLHFKEELGYMVIHGVLHLLGFDHEKTKREAKQMFTLQDSVFQRLLDLRAKKKF